MKKILAVLLATLMITSFMTACATEDNSSSGSSSESANNNDIETEPLKIVTTIFPIYDWAINILGDEVENVDIEILLDTGVDLHSYEPTAEDMISIIECDLFIYLGGSSDDWVDDVLLNVTNENMQVISLFDALGDGVLDEEIVEGMEDDHDHDECEEDHDHDDEECEDEECEEDHDHDDEECDDEECEEDHDHDDEECDDEEESHVHEEDEHVWMSVNNAQIICKLITEKLAELDTDNASIYNENSEEYILKLQEIDAQYAEVVANATYQVILVGDRFPFRYLVEDYDIEYYAAFPGCSSETEASFETITFLAGKVDELDLDTVITVEGSDNAIAESIISNTATKDQEILSLNSMESVSWSDIEDGVTYISIIESNLLILEQALS